MVPRFSRRFQQLRVILALDQPEGNLHQRHREVVCLAVLGAEGVGGVFPDAVQVEHGVLANLPEHVGDGADGGQRSSGVAFLRRGGAGERVSRGVRAPGEAHRVDGSEVEQWTCVFASSIVVKSRLVTWPSSWAITAASSSSRYSKQPSETTVRALYRPEP